MDFLNKAFTQFNDLFRSMSPGGRITAGLLLVVAVVSVGYLFQAQVGGGDEYLFGGASIPTPTLQKMEEAFGKAGLNGFTIEGGRVKVSRAQRAAYLAALADNHAMPSYPGDDFKDEAGAGPFESPSQHTERLKHAKEREISLVLSYMKGIERASVLLDSQPQPGIGQPLIKTASVFASVIGSQPLDDEQVDTICEYVAGAVAGMNPENVTIADANGPVRTGRPRSASVVDDAYAQAARKAEQELNKKIRSALAYVPNLTVTSTVVLDQNKGTRILQNTVDPKGTVALRTNEVNKETSRGGVSPGGAPGLQQQGGGVNTPVQSVGSSGSGSETTKEDKSEVVNASSTTTTESEKYGLTPRSAKVSVGIPASYYEKVWRERNPTKEPGDEKKPENQAAIDEIRKGIIQDVTTHVATLLPPSEVRDPTTLVTVTSFQDIKPVEIPGPAVTQKAFSWLSENWPMLAMVGLVLASLGMLRSALRGVPATAAPEPSTLAARISLGETTNEEKEDSVEATAARRLRRITGSGPSLRDELSEIVKEDPDSAASILRAWIGQAN